MNTTAPTMTLNDGSISLIKKGLRDTGVGKEIIRIVSENEDKAGKVAREVLLLLDREAKRIEERKNKRKN